MDTQYLKAIWDKACKETESKFASHLGGGSAVLKVYNRAPFELPFFDQSQQIVEFIKHHDLKAVQRMKQPLTQEDASWLLSRYPIELIEDTLMDLENYPQLNRKYKSCKLTLNNWCRKRQKDQSTTTGSSPKLPFV